MFGLNSIMTNLWNTDSILGHIYPEILSKNIQIVLLRGCRLVLDLEFSVLWFLPYVTSYWGYGLECISRDKQHLFAGQMVICLQANNFPVLFYTRLKFVLYIQTHWVYISVLPKIGCH